MATWLKQSTAATIVLGPFLDDTDGKTPETGLTIAQADIRLSKNGGAFAQTNNAAGATHMENGYYSIPLNTTDTNTLGQFTLAVLKSGALPCFLEFHVVPATVWDSLIGTGLNSLADGILDRADSVESGLTWRQALRLIVATLAGKISGAGTTTVTIRDCADTKNRIVATVDSSGNRSAVTRTLT